MRACVRERALLPLSTSRAANPTDPLLRGNQRELMGAVNDAWRRLHAAFRSRIVLGGNLPWPRMGHRVRHSKFNAKPENKQKPNSREAPARSCSPRSGAMSRAFQRSGPTHRFASQDWAQQSSSLRHLGFAAVNTYGPQSTSAGRWKQRGTSSQSMTQTVPAQHDPSSSGSHRPPGGVHASAATHSPDEHVRWSQHGCAGEHGALSGPHVSSRHVLSLGNSSAVRPGQHCEPGPPPNPAQVVPSGR